MTHQEILTKAIGKAVAGGYSVTIGEKLLRVLPSFYKIDSPDALLARQEWIRGIIFNHDFARALCGEEERDPNGWLTKRSWKHELQDMVIAEDPIKYLGEN